MGQCVTADFPMVDQTFDRRGNNGSGDSVHRLPEKATRFPIHRSLADLDFSQMKVDESLIKQLTTFEFRPPDDFGAIT